jgi:hypothetical protein
MALVETRQALHAVAEHVLAPARFAATGRIGLRATPNGFGTPPFPDTEGERQVCVRHTDLVACDADGERSAPITTLRDAAAFVDVTPGAPRGVYEPATPLDLDRPLAVDAGAARQIAEWFALADDGLHQFVALHAPSDPSEIQLWPEHFDLATTIDRVNFGASPGDADHGQPYLYVGPFEPRTGPFWNESFGASLDRVQVPDVAAAVGFFTRGLDLSR